MPLGACGVSEPARGRGCSSAAPSCLLYRFVTQNAFLLNHALTGEFLRQRPVVRSGIELIQAELPSSYGNTYQVGPLGSAGITPLHGYYGPRRLPAEAAGRLCFPAGRWARGPLRRASQVPSRTVRTRRPQPPRRVRQVLVPVATLAVAGFTTFGRLASSQQA